MKILLYGKGGSGNSTGATLIARGFKERGCPILLIGGGECNAAITRVIGLEAWVFLSGNLAGGGKEEGPGEDDSGSSQRRPLVLFGRRLGIGDIPENCVAQTNRMKLMIIGKIH